MKNHLHAFLAATILLLMLLGVNSHALSVNASPLNDLNFEASSTSEPPGDAIIQFPDPNFEAAVRRTIGKPIGDIMANDVAGIVSLNVHARDISDLTGIEYFTALTELDCCVNELTMLDVSQNVALTWLCCGANKLTMLDVSNNVALRELICGENLLTSLDISQNPALINLFCGANLLTTLDVSQNSALEVLICWMNRLTTLDVSNNAALTEVDCGENSLTTLDVSQNPALKELSCNDNGLTALDLSQNPLLEWLSIQDNAFPNRSAILGLDESRLEQFVFDPQNGK